MKCILFGTKIVIAAVIVTMVTLFGQTDLGWTVMVVNMALGISKGGKEI
jgi:hypothetical protein